MGLFDTINSKVKSFFGKEEQKRPWGYYITNEQATKLDNYGLDRYIHISKEELAKMGLVMSPREKRGENSFYTISPVKMYDEKAPSLYMNIEGKAYQSENGDIILDKYHSAFTVSFRSNQNGKEEIYPYVSHYDLGDTETFPYENRNYFWKYLNDISSYARGDKEGFDRVSKRVSMLSRGNTSADIVTLIPPNNKEDAERESMITMLQEDLGIDMSRIGMRNIIENVVSEDILNNCEESYNRKSGTYRHKGMTYGVNKRPTNGYVVSADDLVHSYIQPKNKEVASLLKNLGCHLELNGFKSNESKKNFEEILYGAAGEFFNSDRGADNKFGFYADKYMFKNIGNSLHEELGKVVDCIVSETPSKEIKTHFDNVCAIVLVANKTADNWLDGVGKYALQSEFKNNVEKKMPKVTRVKLNNLDLASEMNKRLDAFEDNLKECREQMLQTFTNKDVDAIFEKVDETTTQKLQDAMGFKTPEQQELVSKFNNYVSMMKNIQENYVARDQGIENKAREENKENLRSLRERYSGKSSGKSGNEQSLSLG